MTRRHRLQWFPEAVDDLHDARDWYEEQRSGLGAEFISEFWRVVDAIDSAPTVPHLVELDSAEAIRRWHFDRWPYSVVYMVEANAVIIVAVHHDRRHPRRWTGRV